MDINPQQHSPLPMDFDPPMYREEIEMEFEFEKMAAEIWSRRSANSNTDDLSEATAHSTGDVNILGETLPKFPAEEILGLTEDDMDTNQHPLPNLTWEDYLEGDWSQFEFEPIAVSADLPTSDLPSEDVGMTDMYDYLDVENWPSDLSGEDAFLAQTLPENAEVVNLDMTDFDFSNDQTLGYARHGRTDVLIPQPLFESPAAPLSLFDPRRPANNQAGNSASAVPPPLFNNSRGARKGHFVLLKGGKPLCNLDSGSITAVLDAVSRAQPQANVYRQPQGPANTTLPLFNFTHCEAVDGLPGNQVNFNLPPAVIPTSLDWEQELSALLPPPPLLPLPLPLPPQVSNNLNVPQASSVKCPALNERQERELAQRMARIYDSPPKQHQNATVGRRPSLKPRKTFEPTFPADSDYARHVREAKARALQRAQAEAESEGTAVPASNQSTSPQHSSPVKEPAVPASGKQAASPRRLSPAKPSPAPPVGRRLASRPARRPASRHRCLLLDRTNTRSRSSSGSGFSRPSTRSFARRHGVQLESIEW